jgi:hypothetical protein
VYKSTSAEDHINDITKLARKSFERHLLAKKEKYAWIIRRKNCGFYWAEIRILHDCKILVHGDIEPVVIAATHASPTQIINWAATSYLDYFRQKVSIGMGGIGIKTENIEVATHDLYELIGAVPKKYAQDIRDAIELLNGNASNTTYLTGTLIPN